MWRDEIVRRANESKSRCLNHSSKPLKTAFCIVGSARTFATPLVTTLLKLHWMDALAPKQMKNSFFFLKSRDSFKLNYHHQLMAPSAVFHAHSDKASSLSAIVASLNLLQPHIVEAVILNGSGTYEGTGWRPALDGGSAWSAVRQSDDSRWLAFKSSRCPIVNRSVYPLDNTEERLLNNLLAISWCADAIKRDERRSSQKYDVVAYTRPDLVRWTPMKPFCYWKFDQKVAACSSPGEDGTWVVGRQHLVAITSQHLLHAACEDPVFRRNGPLGSGRYVACCGGAEPLLAYTLFKHSIAASAAACTSAVGSFTFLRQIQRTPVAWTGQLSSRAYAHICDVALHDKYLDSHVQRSVESSIGLSIKTAIWLRKLFGSNRSSECRRALASLDSENDDDGLNRTLRSGI